MNTNNHLRTQKSKLITTIILLSLVVTVACIAISIPAASADTVGNTITLNYGGSFSSTIYVDLDGTWNGTPFEWDNMQVGTGSSYSPALDRDTTYTLTCHSAPANHRYVFSNGLTTYTGTSSSTPVTLAVYEQVSNTYTVFGLTSGYSVAITGTNHGIAGSTLATLSSGNSYSATAYSDYGTTVTFPAVATGSTGTQRYAISSAYSISSLTMGGGTYSQAYTRQFYMTMAYTTNDGSVIPSGTQLGSYTSFGTSNYYYSTSTYGVDSPSTAWIDSGNNLSSQSCSSGSERWYTTSVGWAIGGSYTATVNYYHQYKQTLSYSIVGGGSPSPLPSATGNRLGSSYTQTLSTSATDYWFDASGDISFSSITGDTGERWAPQFSSIASTSAHTQVVPWYHQYQVTLQYSTYDSSAISEGSSVGSYKALGSDTAINAGASYGATSVNSAWVDAGIATVSFTTSTAPSGAERSVLSTSPHTFDVTTSGQITQTGYLHQYKYTIRYLISDGSVGFTAPVLAAKQNGNTYTPSLATSASDYWLDSGSAWSVTNPLGGSGTTQQWYSSQVISGTVSSTSPTTAGGSLDFTYNHQYKVTFTAACGNILTDSSSAIVNVGGTAYTRTSLPFSIWVTSGTSVSWAYVGVVTGTGNYFWVSTSGLGTSGQSGSLTVTSSGTVTGTYGNRVSKPITVTMANSAPSATVTVLGGNPSPSTFAADGTPHTITMDFGAVFKLSFTNTGTVRNGFGIEYFRNPSDDYPASTTPLSVTAYRQSLNTYSVSGLEGTDYVAVTGTFLGSTETIVTLTAASPSQQAWSDYNRAVTFPIASALSGSSQRSVLPGSAYTTTPSTSGGTTVTPPNAYTHQIAMKFYYYVAGGGTPGMANYVRITAFGSDSTITPTLTTNPSSPTGASAVWVDEGDEITCLPIYNGDHERWRCGPYFAGSDMYAESWIGTALATSPDIVAYYYHQYEVPSLSYTTNDGSAIPSGAQIGTCYWFGHLYNIDSELPYGAANVDELAWDNWIDAGTGTVSFSTSVASETEQWVVPSSPHNVAVSGTGSITQLFYHQYKLTLFYQVSGGGSPTVTNVVHYTSNGVPLTATPTLDSSGGTGIWADARTAVTYNSPIAGASGEQWTIDVHDLDFGAPGVHTMVTSVTAAQSVTATYYHQYLYTVNYGVSGGGSPSAPIFTASECSQPTYINNPLSTLAWTYWVDAGSTWSITSILGSSTSTERWATSQTSGTVTAAATTTYTYYHQYAITPYCTLIGGGTPTVTNAVTYTAYGASTTGPLTIGSTGGSPIWADKNTAISYTSPISGGAGERWQIASGDSGLYQVLASVTGSQTVTAEYYHQYQQTLNYQIIGGGTLTSGPTVTEGKKFGAAYLPTLTTSATGYWFDAQTDIELNNPVVGVVGQEQWFVNSEVDSTRANTQIIPLYHQYYITFAYTTHDGSTITAPNVIGAFSFAGTEVLLSSSTTYGQVTAQYNTHWVDAGTGTVIFDTVPSGNERWALSTDTHTIDVTASGTITETGYYHQYSITLGYWNPDSSAIPAGNTIGTYLSFDSGQAILPIGTFSESGGSYGTYGATSPATAWVDAGAHKITYRTVTDGSERWAIYTSPDNIDVDGTASELFEYGYYHFIQIYINYALVGGGSPTAPMLTANQFGYTGYLTTLLDTSSLFSYWIDADSTYFVNNPLIDSGTTERWATSQTLTGTANAAAAGTHITYTYYHQFLQTLSYQIIGGGTPPSGPSVSGGNQFGVAYSPTIAATATGYWFDAQTDIELYNPVAGAPGEQWYVNADVDSTQANTQTIPIIHQYQITFAYTTHDGSTIPSQVIGHFTFAGSPLLISSTATYGQITTQYNIHWVDAGTGKISFNTYTQGGVERWVLSTDPHTIDVAASGTITETGYHHQYLVDFTASANVLGDGVGTVITVDSAAKTRTDLPFSAWYDSGSTVVYDYSSVVYGPTDPTYNSYAWASTSGLSQTTRTGTLTVTAAGTITGAYTLQTATTIDVSAPGSATAGSSFTVTLTVKDQSGDPMPGYTGTVHFTSNDWQAVLPSDYTFQLADGGTKTFTVTLETSGSITVTATDTAVATITGSATLTVDPAGAERLDIDVAPSVTAGTPFSLTITARDHYSNIASGYTGTLHFTSNDTAITVALPSDYTFTATDAGSHTFTVTLTTAGNKAIAINELAGAGLSNSTAVLVNANSLSSIVVGVSSSYVTVGYPVTFSAQGYDAYGNSLGAQVVTYTVNGTSIVGNSVIESTVGTYTVSVTMAGVTVTTANFQVAPVPPPPSVLTRIVITVSSQTVTAGDSVTFTAQGYDQYGSIQGPQTLTYTVNGTTITGNSITKTAAGTYIVSATKPGITITSASFQVNPAPLAAITIDVSSTNVASGTPVTLSATGYDRYNNSLGAQTVTYTVNGVPISGNTVTESEPGDYTISAIGSTANIRTASFHVNHAAIDHLNLTLSLNNMTAGQTTTFTVTAFDQYGNSWDATSQALMSLNSRPTGFYFWFQNNLTVTKAGQWIVSALIDNTTATSTLQVTHAAISSLTVTSPPSAAAGQTASFTATASDLYGNTWDVSGLTSWSINAAAAGSWANNSYTASKSGNWTITATYLSKAATTTLTVTSGTLDRFTLTPQTSSTRANTAFTLTVTAQDSYGNTVTTYSASAALTSTLGTVNPASVTFANGVWTGSISLSTAGSNVITAADNGGHRGTNTITVTQDTYAITVYSDYGSATQSRSVAAGGFFTASVTSPASAGAGTRMVCTGYSVDGGTAQSGTSYTFSDVQVAHSIRFIWEKQYQVTVTASVGGSATPSGSETWVKEGNLAIQANPDTDYVFSGWASNPTVTFANQTQSTTTAYITEPCTVTARFALSATLPGNGSKASTTTMTATQTLTMQTYNVTLYGNITATQMSNMTITPYAENRTTVVAFTVTGESDTAGFVNITLSKSAIPYGTIPIVYIDGVKAANQGYTEDSENYYVWFTTHFSTHQVAIQFQSQPEQAVELWVYLASFGVLALLIVLIVSVGLIRRRK